MRWLRLYLRSRSVPAALATAVAAIAVAWALWAGYAESVTVDIRLVSLTVMLAVVAFAPTLSGADVALEHTGAVNWPVRRAGHLLVAAAVITGPLLLTLLTDARFAPLAVVLRNVAGLLGLTALGAVLFGAARAWIAPLIWTLIAVTPLVGTGPALLAQLAGWLVQPAGNTAAIACAAILAVTGMLAYSSLGCPRPAAAETATDQGRI